MTPIAYCTRERDLVRMTILRKGDGTLVARRRLPDDRIEPTFRTGAFEDLWRHSKSLGLYVRHDLVTDLEGDVPSYDYSSWADGCLWLRPVEEWHADVDGTPRFVLQSRYHGEA